MYIYGGSTGSAVGDFHELNIVEKTWTLLEMAPGPLPAQHRQQQHQQQHIRTPNTTTTFSSRINSPQPTTAWPPTPGSGGGGGGGTNRLIASNFQHGPRQLATDLPAPFPGHVFRTHNATPNTRTQPSNNVTSALHTPYINHYLGVDDLNRDMNLNPGGEDELPDQPWAPAQWPVSEPTFDPWSPTRATGTTGNPRGQAGDGAGFDPAIQHLLGVGSQADDDDEPDNNNTYVSATHTVTNNHTSSTHVVMSASNMVWNNNTNTIPHNYDLPNPRTQASTHHNNQHITHHYRAHHQPHHHHHHHHQHQQPLSSVSTLCYDNTNSNANGGVSAGNRFCHIGVVRYIIVYIHPPT